VLKLFVHQARHAGWKIYICDPDGHTFNPDVWNTIAAAPVASSPADLQILIDRIYGEIADRAAMFRQAADGNIPPADLGAYNALVQGGETPPLPRIGLWVDEANSYMSDRKIFKSLADLLRRGRKWGLQIFLAGHEWHKDVVAAEVNDMLQTRIALTTANEETAQVVLRSRRWSKWVMGKPAGRGVIRIDQYQPMQFYLITEEKEREWLSGSVAIPTPLPEDEASLVKRSLEEEEGKMSIPLLMRWGIDEWRARTMLEDYERRGWVSKDANQKNARCITPKLAVLVSNTQTAQTASSTQIRPQTGLKLSQTPDLMGA
jgi:DNA segregation ATPase FtsK/SpoIIIE-like protein